MIFIFLLLLGSGWARVLPNGCPSDFGVHRLLPHETDCNRFYQCSNGQKVLMTCPGNLNFDVELQVCNWAQLVDCDRTTETTAAPPSTPGLTTTTTSTTMAPTTTTMATSTTTLPTSTTISPPTSTTTLPTSTTMAPPTSTTTLPTSTTMAPPTSTITLPTSTTMAPPTSTTMVPTSTTMVPTTSTTTVPTSTTTSPTTTTAPPIAPPDDNCPYEYEIKLNPHDIDCNKYINCSDGIKILLKCPRCEWPQNVKCANDAGVKENDLLLNGCPADFHVHKLLPHETDCTRFYYCSFGIKVERQCSSGTHFNPTLQVCDWPQNAGCESKVENEFLPNGCPSDSSVHWLLPHETDCAKFYQCVFGQKVERDCAPGTHFDPQLQVCNWPNAVNCTSTSTTTPGPSTTLTPSTTTSTTTQQPITTPSTTTTTSTTTQQPTTTPSTTTTTSTTTQQPTTTPSTTTTTSTTTQQPITTPSTTTTTQPPTPTTTTSTTTQQPTTITSTTTQQPTQTPSTTTTTSTTTQPPTPTTTTSTTTQQPTTITSTTTQQPTQTPSTTTTTSITTLQPTPTTSSTTTISTTTQQPTPTTSSTTTTSTTTQPPTPTTPTTTPSTSTTSTSSTTDESDIDFLPNGCPVDGSIHWLLPHETDCAKFYQCIFGRKVERDCDPGTHFDPRLQVCNWPNFVNCTSQSTTTSTTAASTSTATSSTSTTTASTSTTTESTPTTTTTTTTESIPTTTTTTTTESVPTSTTTTTESIPTPSITTTTESIPTTTTTTTTESIPTPTTTTTTEIIPTPTTTTNTESIPTPTITTTTENIPTTTTTTTTESIPTPTTTTTTESIPTPTTTTTTESIPTPTITTTTESIPTTTTTTTTESIPTPTTTTTTESIPTPTTTTTTESIPTTTTTTTTESVPTITTTTTTESVPTTTTTTTTEIIPTTVQTTNTESIPTITQTTTTESIPTTESETTTEYSPTTSSVAATTTDSIDTTTLASICPPGFIGFIHHPDYCDAYYLCAAGTEKLMWCSEGYEFDPIRNHCTLISEDGCFASKGMWTPTEPSVETTTFQDTTVPSVETTTLQDTTVPSVETTTIHDTTVASVETTTLQETTIPSVETSTLQETTESSVLTTTTLGTTTEQFVTTTESVDMTTPVTLCPPGFIGFVPHPDYCDAYYLCADGTDRLMWCSQGYEFDPAKNHCTIISEGGCFDSQGKWTPTESDETTTDRISTTVTSDDITTQEVTTELSVDTTTLGDTTEPLVDTTTLQDTTIPSDETTTLQDTTVSSDETTTLQDTTIPSVETTTLRETTASPIETTTWVYTTTSLVDSTTIADVSTTENVETTTESIDTTTPAVICRPGVVEFLPHPDYCDAYYLCAGGILTVMWCTEGFEFDTDRRHCVEISEGGCFDSQGKWTPTESDVKTTEGISTTVTPDIKTTQEATTELTVDTTTLADSSTTQRDTTIAPIESTSTTESIETTTPGVQCRPGVIEFLPHPDYCDAFYLCADGTETLMWCSEGFEFDPVRSHCVAISEGGCFDSNGMWTPTQPETTTTYNMSTAVTQDATTPQEVTTEPSVETTTSGDTTDPSVESTTQQDTTVPSVETTTLLDTTDSPVETTTLQDTTVPSVETTTLQDTTVSPVETTTLQDTTVPSVETTTLQDTTVASVETTTLQDSTTENLSTTTESVETTTPGVICQPGVVEFFPHPDYCDAYYLCVANTPTLMWCSDGFEFDPARNHCVEIAEGGCFDSKGKWTPTESDETTTNRISTTVIPEVTTTVEITTEPLVSTTTLGDNTEPSLETTTISDSTSYPVETTTSQDTTLLPVDTTTTQDSTTENLSTTTESIDTTTPDVICQPGVVEYLPHPDYCDAYYLCAAGTPILMWCSDGFEFDPIRNHCVTITEGGCFDSKGKWTPTQSDETTTEIISTTPIPDTTATDDISTETSLDTTTLEDSTTTTVPPVETTSQQETTTSPIEITTLQDTTTTSPIETTTVQDITISTVETTTLQDTTTSPVDITTTESSFDTTTSKESTTENVPTTTESVETTTPAVICQPGGVELLPHPDYCDAYYLCAAGIPTLMWCSEGFEFDPVRNHCVEISEGGCFDSKGKWTPTESDEISTTGKPDTTTTEVLITEPTVDTTTLVDLDTTISDLSTTEYVSTTTESVETTTAGVICQPDVVEFLPHPDYCDAYYLCAAGIPTLMWCSEGFEFDPVRNHCVLISEGGCFDSKGKWTPTESDEISTTVRPDASTTEAITTDPSVDTTTLQDTTEPSAITTTVQLTTETSLDTTAISEQSTTENIPTTTESVETTTAGVICQPDVVEFLPHPDYCDAYYLCAAGIPTLMWCGEGFEYDPDRNHCVIISEGGCFDSKGQWTPTESDATSTTVRPDGTTTEVVTTEPSQETTTLQDTTTPPVDITTQQDTTEPSDVTATPEITTETSFDTTTISDLSTTENMPTTTESVETTTAGVICQPDVIEFLPHPDHCDAYYLCAAGTPTLMWCGEGFEFDPVRNHCVLISEGGCFDSKGKWTPTESDEISTTVRPDASTTEAITTDSSVDTTTLQDNTEPSDVTTTQRLTTETSLDTTAISEQSTTENIPTTTESVETTTAGVICQPDVVEFLPHHDYCDAYYLCAAGTPTLMWCGEGFEFDPARNHCVVISEGGCFDSKGQWTPTESDATSTTVRPDGTTTEVVATKPSQETTTLQDTTTPPVDITTQQDTTEPSDVTTTSEVTTESSFDTTTISDLSTTESMPSTTESVETTTAGVICQPDVIEFLPHPDYCDAYYLCAVGTPTLMWCGDGFEFDPVRNHCVLISEGGCFDSKGKWTPTESDEISTTVRPDASTTEAITTDPSVDTTTLQDNTEPSDVTTTQRLTTETSLDTTAISEQSTTEIIPTTTESVEITTAGVICPPDVVEFLPHPDYCDAYYLCAAGIPTLMWCGEGFEFDPDRNHCVIISEGGCFDSKGQWTPTESDATSTTVRPDGTTTEVVATEPSQETTTLQDITTPPVDVTTQQDTTEPSDVTATSEVTSETSFDTTTISDLTTTENMPTTTEFVETTTAGVICQPDVVEFLPHPDYCDAYYLCAAGTPTLMWCGKGFEFDPDRNHCVIISEGGCFDSKGQWTPTESDATSTTVRPDGTTTEVVATEPSQETTTLQDITTPPVDVTTQQDTTEPSDVTATSEVTSETSFDTTTISDLSTTENMPTTTEFVATTTAGVICQPDVVEFLPHPDHCDAYYLCAAGTPTLMWCGEGFEFDPERNHCVIISEGGCFDSKGKWTPTDYDATSTTVRSDVTTTEAITPEPSEETTTLQDTTTPPVDITTQQDTTEPSDVTATSEVTSETSFDTTTISDLTTTENMPTTTEFVETTTAGVICQPDVVEFLPHPDYCDAYYLCAAGTPTLMWCGKGFEFDPVSHHCVVISDGGCFDSKGKWTPTESDETTTDSLSTSVTPDATTTEVLTTESSEETTTLQDTTTPPVDITTPQDTTEPSVDTTTSQITTDTSFDTTTISDLSTTENLLSTTESIETTTAGVICQPGVVEFLPHPDYCDGYYLCAAGTPILMWCSAGFEFDPASSQCVEISEGGCFDLLGKLTTTESVISTTENLPVTTESIETTTPTVECLPGVVEFIPHPDYCDAYYLCASGIPTLMWCSEGFEFDPVENQCVVISEGGCFDLKGKLTTTISNETTTENLSTTFIPDITATEEITTETSLDTTTLRENTDSTAETTTLQDTSSTPEETTTPQDTTDSTVETTTLQDSTGTPVEATTPQDNTDSTAETTTLDDNTGSPVETTTPPNTTDSTGETTTPEDTTDSSVETTTLDDTTRSPVESTTPQDTTNSTAETTTLDDTTNLPVETTTPEDTTDSSAETTTLRDTTDSTAETTTLDDTTGSPVESTTPQDTTDSTAETTTLDDTTGSPVESTTPQDTTGSTADTTTLDDTTGSPIETTTLQDTTDSTTETTTQDITTSSENLPTTTDIIQTTTPPDVICQPGVVEFLPHPDYCNAYYLCLAGTPTLMWCSEGFEFDPDENQCVAISENGCFASMNTSTTSQQTTTEAFDTTQENEISTTRSPDYTVEPIETTTEYVDTTTVSEGTTEGSICPPDVYRNIPHPDYCDHYYLCMAGVPLLLSCSEGYEFDPVTAACVEISEDGCFASRATTPSDVLETTIEQETTSEEDVDVTSDNYETTSVLIQTTTDEQMTTEPIESTTMYLCPPDFSGFIPDPNRCDRFFQCIVGTPTALYCGDGMEFDPGSKQCVEISENGCYASKGMWTPTEAQETTSIQNLPEQDTTDTIGTTENQQQDQDSTDTIETTTVSVCPPNFSGIIPDPEHCNRFIHCTVGHPIALVCADGFEFDPETLQCVPISENGCFASQNMSTSQQTTTEEFDITTDSENTTPEGSDSGTTTGEEAVEMTTDNVISTTVSQDIASICPPDVFGNIPHPDRCDAYYMCIAGESTLLTCSIGHEFNPQSSQCVVISENGCYASKGMWTPTEAQQTSSVQNLPEQDTTDNIGTTVNQPQDQDSTDRIETTTPSVCPPNFSGIIPDPEHCDRFVHCTVGHPIPLFCGDEFEFDPKTQQCVPISENGCFASKNMSTSQQTTTEEFDTTTDSENMAPEDSDSGTTTSEKAVEITTDNIISTTVSQETTSICPPNVFGNIPHPDRCDVYYMCIAGESTLLTCSSGHEFDPQSSQCVPVSEDGCLASRSQTPVQSETTTNLPSKNEYTTPEEQIITEEFVLPELDNEESETKRTETTVAPIEITTESICPPHIFGNVPDPNRCDRFFMCTAGTAIPLYCGAGFEFDPNTQRCEVISENGCFASKTGSTAEGQTPEKLTTTDTIEKNKDTSTDNAKTTSDTQDVETSTVICQPGVFGNVADPNRCDKFYMCTAGIAIPLYCGTGFEFDPVVKDCVLISDNGCTALRA